MSKFLSGRQTKLKLGVQDYTESKTVLQTTGKVGIGTTDAQAHSLFVVGSTNIVGHTETDTLNVSGLSTFQGNVNVGSAITMYASTGIISATQFYGDGSNLLNTGATLSAAGGTQRLVVTSLTSGTMVDAATDSDLTYNAATDTLNVDNLIVAGNLTVDGDQTILNVTQLEVEDINIGIASASTKLNNAQLDGAGITIHGSQGDKTLTWDNSNSRLGFNTDLYVPKVETGHAQITGGISTDGYDTGNPFELMRADGNGGWSWASVPGIFSVNNILNGFNVYEEGLVVGTAGSIHTLDFRGINVTATAAPQPNGIATVTFSTRPSFDETYITGLSTTGRLIVAGISTFNGEIDANGRIVAAATNNVIPFLYSNLGDLPSAVSFHGAFAHVHGTGKAYYAHAANWYELVNKDLNGTVGTGTERYNIGPVDLTTLDVSGISTFAGLVDINGGGQANTFKVEDLTDNRVVIAGTGGELEDDANLTFDGSKFNVGSAITAYAATGIVSATAFYGDGSNLLNTGATLSAASGLQRLVVTDLTSGTMVDAATDGDLTFNASNNSLAVPNINVSVGATFGGTITAGSSEGVVGQYLRHVGTGVTWANFPTLRTTTTITATHGQTVFGFTHNTNFLDVFVNGVKLSSSEYSSNGSSVTLNVGSFAGDVIELHSYNTASTYGSGGGGGGISLTDLSVTTANSPLQLGALAYNNSNGVFTFTPPDVQGQSRQALSVGTPNNPLQVGAISYNNGTGVFTYTPPDLSSYVQTNSSASFSGIDVTGHTETDTLRVSGISTFQNNVHLLDDDKLLFGGSVGTHDGLEIYHDGNHSYIDDSGTGNLYLRSGTLSIQNLAGSKTSALFQSGGGQEFYHNNTKKFETTNTGATVTGTLTATSFSGSGSSLTGLTGASAATYGGASVSPQITVDANGRITSITNVSIAGGGGGGGTSIIVQDSQSLVGAAGTIDFGTGLSVSAISAGVATVTAAGITTHDVSTNTLNVTGVSTFQGNATFQSNVRLGDGDKLILGSNLVTNDLELYHGGSLDNHGYLTSNNGNLYLTSGSNGSVHLRGYNTSNLIVQQTSVQLKHSGNQKLETKSDGVDVTGEVQCDSLDVDGAADFSSGNVNFQGSSTAVTWNYNAGLWVFSDNAKAAFGSSNDLQIYHNGTNSHIENGTGQLLIRAKTSENSINCIPDGQVELYYDNSKKLETTSTGAVVTGILTATTFSGSGASLTNLPAANLTGTLPAISGANLTNLPAPTPADTDVQITYDVSSNGSSAYRFTGPGYSGADDNPDIYLVRGQRYRFINGTGSSHPFRIQSDTSGTAYTDGVSGSQNGTQDFNVQHDAPARLYYQCTIHSGMIGNIYVVGGSDWRMTDVATNATPEIYTDRNVGIGTDNPSNMLHIEGSSPSIRMKVSGGPRHMISPFSGDLYIEADNDNTNADTNIRFQVDGSEKLRITSDGKVRLPDNGNLAFGADDDMLMRHSGNDAVIENTVGHIYITNYTNDEDIYLRTDDGSGGIANYVECDGSSGRVKLYHYGTKKFETDTSGVNVTGDVQITSGNLVVDNGNGISFSATSNANGTMSSELLDDYEEGTWTPTVTSAGSIGSPQYNCTYTKIGRLVTINADIHALTNTTSSSNIVLGGLPYIPSTSGGEWCTVCMGERYNTTLIVAFIQNDGGWRIRFRTGVGSGNYADLTHAAINDNGTDNNLRFTLTYEVL